MDRIIVVWSGRYCEATKKKMVNIWIRLGQGIEIFCTRKIHAIINKTKPSTILGAIVWKIIRKMLKTLVIPVPVGEPRVKVL